MKVAMRFVQLDNWKALKIELHAKKPSLRKFKNAKYLLLKRTLKLGKSKKIVRVHNTFQIFYVA